YHPGPRTPTGFSTDFSRFPSGSTLRERDLSGHADRARSGRLTIVGQRYKMDRRHTLRGSGPDLGVGPDDPAETPSSPGTARTTGEFLLRGFITGASGLIGRRLVQRLIERGDHPVLLARRADEVRRIPAMRGLEVIQGDPTVAGGWDVALDGCDAVVNLAGH